MPKLETLWTPERRAEARRLYEQEKLSLAEVAQRLRSNQRRVAAAIRTAGGTLRGRGAPLERNGFWKGGRVLDKHGYVLVKVPGHPHANAHGYVREHRLVVEQVLGRYLDPREAVHHVNGDHADNRPENLEVFESNGSHLAHELKGRCPNWTEEGKARIAEAARRPRKRKPR
jgi:transposase-like protein/uncharacterized protein (DUF1330 family)